MKIKSFFPLVFIIFIIFQSCKKDEITDDEYEIINLLTSKISKSIPPPLPSSTSMKMEEKEYANFLEKEMKKDSIENSKKTFHIYFKDSIIGLDKDFQNKLFEKVEGFDEFHLKPITLDLTKSKKIDLSKLKFPKNIKIVRQIDNNPKNWKKDFLGKYWVSRIIFNKEKNKAIMETNHVCGNLCGGGSKVYLSKIGGKWKIIEFFNSWVS